MYVSLYVRTRFEHLIEYARTWIAHGLGQIVQLDSFPNLVLHVGRFQPEVLDIGESTRGYQKAFALKFNITITLR